MLEEQKSIVETEACALRQSLGEVEAARLETRRTLHDVKRQLKNVDAESCRLRHDLADLQQRDRRHEERLEMMMKDNQQLTQTVR